MKQKFLHSLTCCSNGYSSMCIQVCANNNIIEMIIIECMVYTQETVFMHVHT